jgi:hypothetical protein
MGKKACYREGMIQRLLTLLACLTGSASAFVIGNPGQPWLMKDGVLPYKNEYCSLRAAYLNDLVYSQQFKTQLNIGDGDKPPINRIASETTQITLNFVRRLDVYGILGTAKLQMDKEVYSKGQFAWGAGAKALMYQGHGLQVGCDFKYFQTEQTPEYLVSSGYPLRLASDLKLSYEEYQGAVGCSYRSGIFCPYIAGTYINAKITPSQNKFLIHAPGMDELLDANTRTYINSHTWGMAVGGTLLMGEKGSFTIESRFINQNGIDASLEIRF